jgi:hypothetical protein
VSVFAALHSCWLWSPLSVAAGSGLWSNRGVNDPSRLAAIAALALVVVSAQVANSQAPTFQVSSSQASDGRTLLATVVDMTGKPLVDVGADDFVVEESGEERDVLDVHVADYPVAVLIDDAPDTAALSAIKAAVGRFITRIGERPVALGTLSNPSQLIAGLEDDRETVLARTAALTISGAPAVTLPAVAHAARVLQETGAPFSAIVIVSGRSIDARNPVDGALLPSILASGAAIHVVESRVAPANAADGSVPADVPDLLRVLSDQTHGQYATIFSSVSYSIALDRLADRLSAEMMIQYLVPSNTRAGDVRVGVRRPGARVLGLGVK